MAYNVAIAGRSGMGKSTSIFPIPELKIVGLPPEETAIINVSNKPLVIRGAERLYPVGRLSEGGRNVITSDPKVIAANIREVDTNIKYKNIKYLVVEDAQYIQGFTFMNKLKSDEGYAKFNDTGEAAWLPLKAMIESTRKDLFIFFIFHTEYEKDGSKDVKIKTSGKVVDNYLTIEGLFTTILYCYKEFDPVEKKGKAYFTTQSDGFNTAKSPPGMFPTYEIPNDLGYVVEKMKEFYQ